MADIAAGIYAYSGILSALFQRERTGTGSILDIAMLEALGEWMSYPAYYAAYGGTPPARTGAHHAVLVPYGPVMCGDGKTVFLSIQNSREWQAFCAQVLEQPALATDARYNTSARRLAARTEVEQLISAVFAQHSAETMLARLDAAGIANARLNSVQEFWEHPQLAARDRWRTIETEIGPVQAMLPPVTIRGQEAAMGPVPALGAHTDALLGEYGYDRAAIARLRAEGAI